MGLQTKLLAGLFGRVGLRASVRPHHRVLAGLRVGVLGAAPLVPEQVASLPRLGARGAQDGVSTALADIYAALPLDEPVGGVSCRVASVVGVPHRGFQHGEDEMGGLPADVLGYVEPRGPPSL